MAKANLPVNFKDDVLASAMNGKRRYNMIQNSDGTVSFEDVTDYTQVGSTFGAAQINATNEAINNAADASKIIDSLETIKANTQSGYIAGALAVKALSSNLGSELKETTYTTSGTIYSIEKTKNTAVVILNVSTDNTQTYHHVFLCDCKNSKLYYDGKLRSTDFTMTDDVLFLDVQSTLGSIWPGVDSVFIS